jgi:RNase P subunit RPR2
MNEYDPVAYQSYTCDGCSAPLKVFEEGQFTEAVSGNRAIIDVLCHVCGRQKTIVLEPRHPEER